MHESGKDNNSIVREATINIREPEARKKKVKIAAQDKPEIGRSVVNKWQTLLDTVAKIAKVPSALIMQLNEETINVFLKSDTDGNPYEVGEEAKLIYGLYCETVIGNQQELTVPDATKNPVWKDNNPDIDLNMIAYLGFPINWPDGEIFGTVCLLDNKENHFNEDFKNLLQQMKNHIETDLTLLSTNEELKEKNQELEQLNTMKTRFLSLISHDVRGGISVLDEFLKLTIENIDFYEKSKIKTILGALSQNARSAYLTLENLLNWSKNDILQLQPNKTQVNIIELLEQLTHYFEQAISLKSIELQKSYSSARVYTFVDENMLTTSLRNILSNAIKYSYNGSKIEIRAYEHDNKCIIEVEDSGMGMTEDKLNMLFNYDKYHKKQGTRGESSSGIGLMITKEFLDKNNAEVFVKSEKDKGTLFRIEI